VIITKIAAIILWLSLLPSGRYPAHMTDHPAQRARVLAEVIVQTAEEHGLDPVTMVALARHESGFDQAAVSAEGAFGIFQAHPRYWGRELLKRCLGNPQECLWWQSWTGAAAFAFYVKRCGSEGRALTAYRSGRCGAPGPEALKVLATRKAIRRRMS
jgi:hypothetical protein